MQPVADFFDNYFKLHLFTLFLLSNVITKKPTCIFYTNMHEYNYQTCGFSRFANYRTFNIQIIL